jgi:hypothetical protein
MSIPVLSRKFLETFVNETHMWDVEFAAMHKFVYCISKAVLYRIIAYPVRMVIVLRCPLYISFVNYENRLIFTRNSSHSNSVTNTTAQGQITSNLKTCKTLVEWTFQHTNPVRKLLKNPTLRCKYIVNLISSICGELK